MCFLSIINYSNVLRIKIKSVYVKDFLISTKVRLKRGEHLHGEEPISSEPTFNCNDCPDHDCYLILRLGKMCQVSGVKKPPSK